MLIERYKLVNKVLSGGYSTKIIHAYANVKEIMLYMYHRRTFDDFLFFLVFESEYLGRIVFYKQ